MDDILTEALDDQELSDATKTTSTSDHNTQTKGFDIDEDDLLDSVLDELETSDLTQDENEDFNTLLRKVLDKHFKPEMAARIHSKFQQIHHSYIQSLSLDEIEGYALHQLQAHS